ncbi:MAG: hypothetical protein AAGD25_06890 [Cyanobacteria bacterium P01_F01_bin.150]
MKLSAKSTLTWGNLPFDIPDDATATYTWGGESAPYAADVYFGDGYSPGRPWVDYVVEYEDGILDDLLLDSLVYGDIRQTFINFAFSLGFAFQEAIEAPIWDWPGRTVRSDGSVVSSPRDIVDKGTLRDSQTIDITGV